jgi:hypothetical protein
LIKEERGSLLGHIRTVSLKLLFNGLPLFLILVFGGGLHWLIALIVSLAVSLISYFLGDVFILPAYGNLAATLADGGLVLLLLYMLRYAGMVMSISTIFYCVIAVLLVEGLFYHPYLKRLVTFDSMDPKLGNKD